MILLTSWDDGHPSDEKLADLLGKHGIAATFFIPLSNKIENRPVLQDTAIRSMDSRFEIASHTKDHQRLAGVDSETARKQITEGRDGLQQVVGHAVQGFCYPGGKFTAETVSLVRNAGFKYARTVENLRTSLGEDPFRMPTTIQFYPHPWTVLAWNGFSSGGILGKMGPIVVSMKHRDLLARLLAMANRCADSNSVFHLWGHSWEIDALNLWSLLDQTLLELARLKPICQTISQTFESHGIPSTAR